MPSMPDLDQLRNRAKDLLRAFRADDPLARKRVALHLPHLAAPPSRQTRDLLLADALLVIAREHDFRSWPRLKAHLEAAESEGFPRRSYAWRAELVHDLAAEAMNRTHERDSEGLVRCFTAIPLRTLLTLRTLLAEEGELGSVVEVLIDGLRHPSPVIRYESAQLMDHLADDRCIEPLRRLLHDPVPRVRRIALHALSCEACKISPLATEDDFVALAIAQATADPSITVRRHAVGELSRRVADPRAAAMLRDLLASESDRVIVRYARGALRREGGGIAEAPLSARVTPP